MRASPPLHPQGVRRGVPDASGITLSQTKWGTSATLSILHDCRKQRTQRKKRFMFCWFTQMVNRNFVITVCFSSVISVANQVFMVEISNASRATLTAVRFLDTTLNPELITMPQKI